MKRFITVWMCLVMVLSLAACGGAASPAQETAPTEAPAAVEAAAAPEDEAAAEMAQAAEVPAEEAAAETEPETEPETNEAVPAYDEAAYQTALDCVGRPAEELIAALGEPADAQYAASCLIEDAEDGMLYYDGFYVWTVRTDTEELVHDVYLNE